MVFPNHSLNLAEALDLSYRYVVGHEHIYRNFGVGNWVWNDCLQRQSIAVMDDVRVNPFWQRDDREVTSQKRSGF
jgi:hypothetical protein